MPEREIIINNNGFCDHPVCRNIISIIPHYKRKSQASANVPMLMAECDRYSS